MKMYKEVMIETMLKNLRPSAYIWVEKARRKRQIKRHSFSYKMINEEQGTGYYIFKIKKGYTLINGKLNNNSVFTFDQTYSYVQGAGTFTIRLTITLSDLGEG